MSSPKEMQKRLQKLQKDEDKVSEMFGKLVSGGKLGYKAVIDKREEEEKCGSCGMVLEGTEKFCPECGEKVGR